MTGQCLQGDAPGLHLGLVGIQGHPGEVQTQIADLGFQPVISLGRPRLTAEGSQLPFDLPDEVLESEHVLVGSFETALGFLLAAAVFEDARCLLDHGPVVLGRGVEHLVDLTLPDDHMLMTANARVTEQFLHVEQPAAHAIDLVVGRAIPVQTTGQGHLVEIQGQPPLGVVDDQGCLGPIQRRASCGAGEDDVFHLPGPQRLGGLRPHHPRQGVDEVGLAGAVRAHDHGHPGPELESGPVGERLETDELQ